MKEYEWFTNNNKDEEAGSVCWKTDEVVEWEKWKWEQWGVQVWREGSGELGERFSGGGSKGRILGKGKV